jgi:hypothetical protein
MSPVGTKRTCRGQPAMSALGGNQSDQCSVRLGSSAKLVSRSIITSLSIVGGASAGNAWCSTMVRSIRWMESGLSLSLVSRNQQPWDFRQHDQ